LTDDEEASESRVAIGSNLRV